MTTDYLTIGPLAPFLLHDTWYSRIPASTIPYCHLPMPYTHSPNYDLQDTTVPDDLSPSLPAAAILHCYFHSHVTDTAYNNYPTSYASANLIVGGGGGGGMLPPSHLLAIRGDYGDYLTVAATVPQRRYC